MQNDIKIAWWSSQQVHTTGVHFYYNIYGDKMAMTSSSDSYDYRFSVNFDDLIMQGSYYRDAWIMYYMPPVGGFAPGALEEIFATEGIQVPEGYQPASWIATLPHYDYYQTLPGAILDSYFGDFALNTPTIPITDIQHLEIEI